jgi:hypothetical protein
MTDCHFDTSDGILPIRKIKSINIKIKISLDMADIHQIPTLFVVVLGHFNG